MSERAGFADHFSAAAREYARYRPGYPDALFDWLAARSPARRRAWDCATGNGQAALPLADRFDAVVASDASIAQLEAAPRHPRVAWLCARAEASALAGGSMDLVTVAQALHWFAGPPFYAEAARVLAPGGVLAAWSYGLLRIAPAVDQVMDRLYVEVIGPHWPPERRLVDLGYRTLAVPLPELPAPPFHLALDWTLADLFGYVGTWSGARRYREATGRDALDTVRAELTALWGDPADRRPVRWPLVVRAWRR